MSLSLQGRLALSSDVRATLGPTLPNGAQLAGGRLQIVRTLGRGGTGILYQASDAVRGCDVALKQLRYRGPEALYALKLEFRALRDVSHPNIVRLHELFADDDGCYFTMDLVDGVTFDHWVRPDGAFDEGRLRAALEQLLDAVAVIHGAGKLHRDLKPSNVLVTHAGQVVVLDFGLVTDCEPRETLDDSLPSTSLIGTPAYMAPELSYGLSPSPASDLYAIGVMLYEALTGKLPFMGSGCSILIEKRERPAVLPAQLDCPAPQALCDLCLQLLARDPSARPALDAVRAVVQVNTRTLPRPPRIESPSASGLVGREAELRQLTAAYGAALSGQLTVVMLAGESGIGKTAVCEQFLRRLQADKSAVVLAGRCYERESLPFKAIDPLIDELTRYLRGLPPEAQYALLPRDAGALVQLFPVLGRVPAFAAAHARTFRDLRELQRTAFAALVELWSRLRERGPLVIHVDDLQWTDADSVTFLRYLFIHTQAPALLFVGSHRGDAGGNKLLQRVLEAARSNRACALTGMTLGPLSAAEAEQLAMRLLPEGAADAAVEVARESAGSPFFVGELARFAAEVDGPRLPQLSLGEVLRARCEPLPERAQRLLEVLALVGYPLPIDVALAAADADHSEIDGLREARWVRLSASVSARSVECFHDRIRETVYARLSAERIQAYYVALARALRASEHSDPELMCRFLDGAGERSAAAEHALLAAEQAGEALAFEHAASLYQRALDLGDFERDKELALTSKLALALENAGLGLASADAYERAAALSTGDQRREFRRRAAEQLLAMGHLARGTELMADVARELGLTLPLSTSAAVLSNVRSRFLLQARDKRLDRPPARAPSNHEALQLRAARSALTGLVGYMPLQASAIAGLYLLQAMELDDTAHRVHAEGFSAFLMSMLDPDDPRVAQYLARIAAIGSCDTGPELSGFTALMHGTSAYNLNRFSEGRRHLARCLRELRGCIGVEWEVDAAHVYDQLCALHAGDHTDIARTTPPLIEEAFRRGRRWAGSMLSGFAGSPAWLLADDTDGYRRALALARQGWDSQETLRWPDYVLMIGEAYVAIYSGEAYPAYLRLEGARGSAASLVGGARSGAGIKVRGNSARWILVHQGRCAASALDDGRNLRSVDVRALIATLERCSQKLRRREGQIWQGFAAMFQGALAAHRGEREASLLALQRSLAHLEVDGLAMHVAAARRRIGQLLGGDRGRELLAAGDAYMQSQAAVNLEATTELHCPGFRRLIS